MLLNQERARRILVDNGLGAVILSTPGNVLYASDCVTEFMLGRFEDFAAAVFFSADEVTGGGCRLLHEVPRGLVEFT